MFKLTIKADDYNEIIRIGKLIKPDPKSIVSHKEILYVAIRIDNHLSEAEALFCDSYIYGKYVFQVQEIKDTYSEAKPCLFTLPRQATEAAQPGTYVSITWRLAEETERHLTTFPVYCTIEGTSKFGIPFNPEVGVPSGFWPLRSTIEPCFNNEPSKMDLCFDAEKLQKFAAVFPKKIKYKLYFRDRGIFGKASNLNNEWYVFTLGMKDKKGDSER